MIKIESKCIEAKCDICNKDINSEYGPNYGLLESRFGFDSKFDFLSTSGSVDHHPNKVVCEDCWEKALKALGLDPTQFSGRSA